MNDIPLISYFMRQCEAGSCLLLESALLESGEEKARLVKLTPEFSMQTRERADPLQGYCRLCMNSKYLMKSRDQLHVVFNRWQWFIQTSPHFVLLFCRLETVQDMTAAPVAPDGGFWGWMAVFACFMGNLIGDGVMYSFGVFVPIFKEYFECGSGEVSTIVSIQMGVTFGSG